MLFILHADHEPRSTSTVRLDGSSRANLFASISGEASTRIWGPYMAAPIGGCPEVLEGIRDSGDDVSNFVRKVKNREAGVKFDGFRSSCLQELRSAGPHRQEPSDKIWPNSAAMTPYWSIAKGLEKRR